MHVAWHGWEQHPGACINGTVSAACKLCLCVCVYAAVRSSEKPRIYGRTSINCRQHTVRYICACTVWAYCMCSGQRDLRLQRAHSGHTQEGHTTIKTHVHNFTLYLPISQRSCTAFVGCDLSINWFHQFWAWHVSDGHRYYCSLDITQTLVHRSHLCKCFLPLTKVSAFVLICKARADFSC